MRIAAISDIHGNLDALEAVLADIGRRGADLIVNLGDILSGPLWPRETADRLMALDLPTIRGNHERQLLADPKGMGASDRHAFEALEPAHLAWIEAMPVQLRPADDILLVHGTPGGDLHYFLETVTEGGLRPATPAEIAARASGAQESLILCGHTHVPRVARLAEGRMVANPGSVGLQAYDDVRPFPHKVEIGTPDAHYAIVERAGSAWTAEIVRVAYDWRPAAALAASRGRPDWAAALATGRLPPSADAISSGAAGGGRGKARPAAAPR